MTYCAKNVAKYSVTHDNILTSLVINTVRSVIWLRYYRDNILSAIENIVKKGHEANPIRSNRTSASSAKLFLCV